MRRWIINLHGFVEHEREATTADKAKYADFKAAREAGYFQGRFGFHEYLTRLIFVRGAR